ncbi:MAG: hypothetical protein COV44_06030 [Deltaproteobacteria bacterium CG11_big_fil_rev_8_21_14_0_20_45_16]|nr:MAG: hypothetical protein COV44_06030 [Deltaproteobacteria bacterium CG11_big_fil_rev_8_21_14_0_20_45_16]
MFAKAKVHLLFLTACGFSILVLLWSALHWFDLKSGSVVGPSFCNINSYWNCDRVTASEYGSLFSLPIGIYGAALLFFYATASFAKGLYSWRLALLGLPACLISIVMAGVLILKLQAGCIVCYASYLGIFVATISSQFIRADSKLGILSIGKISFISLIFMVFLGFFALRGLESQPAAVDEQELQLFKDWFAKLPQEEVPMVSKFRKGNFGAKIKVVEFSDFACPHCQRAALQVLPEILTRPDVEFLFYPLPMDGACHPDVDKRFHMYSCDWSQVMVCLWGKSEFWTVHDQLFAEAARAGELRSPDLNTMKDVGISDPGAMKACLDSQTSQAELGELIEASRKLNVKSTPTFFINGRRLEGLLDAQKFNILLDEASRLLP